MAKINVSLGFTADTSQAQRQIDELARSLAKISQNPATLLDDTDLRDAVGAAKELEKHLQKAYNVETGKLDLSQFSRSLASAGKDLNYFQKNLSKLGADGDQAFLNLAKNIAKAETPTIRLNGHIQNLLDDLIKVTRWQISSSIMHGFMGAVQTAHGYAQDLNESLTNIRIVTGQNTDEMAKFAEKANDAAKALSTTTVDYSDAALIYYQQGLEESDIEERTAITIKMANAVGQSVETVSEQLTAIWNNYYDGSKSLEYYADVLMRLGADTASSSDEISEGLGKFSAVADQVGLSYEYAASALATITATTRESANTVGTALKTLFSRIQGLNFGETLEDGTDLNKYSAALAKVGVDIKTTNGDLKDMDDILDEVGARWQNLASDQRMALAQTVAGVRQYNQFVALMDSWDYFQQNLNSSLNSTGSLTEQAEIYADSWEASKDRVRAAAEGIYQALIDDNFFIDFNDGLAKALEGVEGFTNGLGGMKGILSTVGSIILSIYAKEIPSTITKLTDNFKILTGQATSTISKLQSQNINSLESFSFNKDDKSLEMEKRGLLEVAKLKQQLTERSYLLSEAEKKQAEATIEATQASYDRVVSLQKEVEAQEEAWNDTSTNNIKYLKNEYLALGESYEKAQQHLQSLQAQQTRTDLNEEQYSKLKEQIFELEDWQPTGMVDSFDQLNKIVGLTEKQLRALGQYNPSKSLSKQAKEVQDAYKILSDKIEEVQHNLENNVKTFSKLNSFGNILDNQINAWENNDRSIEESKREVDNYIKSLKQIAIENPELNIDFNNDEFLILEQALQNSKIKVEQLTQVFLNFLKVLKSQAQNSINSCEEEVEKFTDDMVMLSGNTRQARDNIEKMVDTLSDVTDKGFRASNAFKAINSSVDDLSKKVPKTSEVLGNWGSALGALEGTFYSFKEVQNVFSDENASNLERIFSLLGIGVSSTNALKQAYKGLDSSVKLLSKSTDGLIVKKAAETAGWKLNTAAISAASKALLLNPWTYVTIAILAVVGALAKSAMAFKEEAKAAKESAEANNELVKQSKEQIDANTNLVRSMEESLKAYKETGEGKDELDEITNSLAEAYGLEGAALAKLSGEYSNYQSVLNKAKQKQIEELEEHKDQVKQASNTQREAILYTAREGNGRLVGDNTYKITFGGIGDEEAKAEEILYKNLSNTKKDNFIGVNSNSITTSIKFDIDSIIKYYEELKIAKEKMESEMSDSERASSDIYKEASEWLERMSTSIETYKEHQQTISAINLKLNNSEANINSYSEYINWAKKVREEISKTASNADEIEEIFASILEFSTNPELKGFQEMEQAIDAIKATGTEVSEYTLQKLWSSFDKATLSSLNWGALTEQSINKILDLTTSYSKAAEEALSMENVKAGAEEVLSLYKDDKGISLSNYKEALEALDWGNAELGIIDFTQFLELNVEKQKEYLDNLANQSLIPTLETKIEKAKETITEYQNWLNSKQKEISDAQEIQNELDDLKKIYSYYKNIYEQRGQAPGKELSEALHGINFNLLGLESLNASNIQEYFKTNGKDFYEDFLNTSKKISNSELILNAAFNAEQEIKELQDDIDSTSEEIEILGKLEIDSKDLDEYLKDLDYLITLEPNTEEYNKVLNEILEADNTVFVEIQGQIDEQLEKAKEDLNAIREAAALIGDDFLVAADDVETLATVFPNILTNATLMEDGMIQLNSSIAQSAIDAAKTEADASLSSVRDRIEAENIVLREKIKSGKERISVLNTLATKEKLTELEVASLKERLTEEITNKHEEEDEKQVKSSNESTSDQITNLEQIEEKADEAAGNTATAFAEGYDEAQVSSGESASIQGTYAFAVAQMNKAAAEGDPETVQQILSTLPTSSKGKILSSYKPNFTKNFTREESVYENPEDNTDEEPSAVKYANLEQEIKDAYAAEQTLVEEQVKEWEKTLETNENILQALELLNQETDQQLNYVKSGLGTDGKRDEEKSKKEKELKTKDLMDEVDIYADIDDEIESINARLESQQEITSHLEEGTAEYLKSLDEEKKIIEELNKKYLEKKEIAKASLAGLQKEVIQLNGEITFSDDGRITNSAKVLSGLQNQINAVITEFNNSKDAAEQEILEAELEALEAHYESLENAINQYRDTLDLIREIDQALQENHYALQDIETNKVESVEKLKEDYEKKIKEWQEDNYENLEKQLELSIQIDDNELKKLDYYIDKLSDDFYSMAEAVQYMVDKVPVISNSLGNYENFYNSISTAYANGEITQEDYLDGMQKSYDAILDNLSALNELDKEMMHYYENTLAAAQEEINHYADSLEHLTSILEHYKNIVELVDGEYNFDAIDTILRGQTQTIENEMEVAQATYKMMLREKQAIEASMANVESGSAAWELFNNELQAITEAVNEAEEEMLSKTEEWAEAMKAVMENTFNKAAYEMEMAMTEGIGFDALNDSLDRLSSYQEIYLTNTNEIYELSKLMRTAQQAADKTDNVVAKQKLSAYQKEIETLKNDGIPLSKLELEIAQARYDVLLAEIALEEAQNAKSTVRLQRDSEGNFGYVYTADSEAISQAEEDLMDAQNKLYNIGLEATNDYGQKMLELQQQLSDDLLQLEQDRANGRFQTEADYEAAKALLIQEYNDLFIAYSDQYTTALGVDAAIQEEAWINAYDSMINQTQNWQEYTTEYTQICEQAYNEWRTAVAEHNEIIQGVLNNTKEKVNEVTEASDELKEEVIREVIPAVERELRQVRNITEAYARQREAIQDLINYYEQLAAAIQEAIAAQAQMQMQQAAESYGEIKGIRDYSAAMSDYLEIDGHTMDDAYYKALKKAREEKMQQDEYSDEISTAELELLFAKYKKAKDAGIDNEMTRYVESISEGNNKSWDRDKVHEYIYGKSNISTYRSGGYTGEWGPSGRLAILHEKELVLNATDTSNLLKAAEIIRQVSDIIDLEAVSNQFILNSSRNLPYDSFGKSELEQHVTIEANFPGVQDRFEIEEAFNNLINTASQYANRK